MWREFVELAEKAEVPFATLCARYGVSRKTGYKWLKRFRTAGHAGLQPQSRRPKTCPRRTPAEVVDTVLAMRRAEPGWSVARIHQELAARGIQPLPAPSTVDLILRRQREAVAAQHQAPGFELRPSEPNFRWEFQTGAEIVLADGLPVVPVVARDEATGFILGATLLDERVEEGLRVFAEGLLRQQGLPWKIVIAREESLRQEPPGRVHSPLTVWLMRLGITVEFSFSPPVRGRPEETEARQQLAARLANLSAYQSTPLTERLTAVDPLQQFARAGGRLTRAAAMAWLEQLRNRHNFGGKHEMMQRETPLSRYRPSARRLPEAAPVPVYGPEVDARRVSEKGIFSFRRRLVHVGRAFAGLGVELRTTPWPDRFMVFFASQGLGLVDISAAPVDAKTSLPLRAV